MKMSKKKNEAWRSTCIIEHNMTGMFCYSVFFFFNIVVLRVSYLAKKAAAADAWAADPRIPLTL